MTDVVPRKRPWELHAIVVLFAIALGYAVSSFRVQYQHQMILAGMVVLLIGLFRGHRFAWWATFIAFLILNVLTLKQSVETLQRYGFYLHPELIRRHAPAALSLVSLLLLVLCWYRGAIPPPAAPLIDELPAARRVVAVVAPILFLFASLFSLTTIILFETGQGWIGERYAALNLKMFCSAEADFRANDRDWNHINDYWTADVRGLWSIVPANGKEPVKLIELPAAAADGNPALASPSVPGQICPYKGVWFSALIEDRSKTPVEPYGKQHPSKFGFIAYPDNLIDLECALIVNEDNTIYFRRLNGNIRPSDQVPPGPFKVADYSGWPSDKDHKAHWSRRE